MAVSLSVSVCVFAKSCVDCIQDHLRQGVAVMSVSVLSMTMHRQLYVHFALLKIPPKFMTHFLLCWKRNEDRDKYEYEYSNISISISINVFTCYVSTPIQSDAGASRSAMPNPKSRCKTCESSFHIVTVCAMLKKPQVSS